MSKSYNQKFKKNDKTWSTFAPNSKLQVEAVGHVYEHNAIEWVENWRYTKAVRERGGGSSEGLLAECWSTVYIRMQSRREADAARG